MCMFAVFLSEKLKNGTAFSKSAEVSENTVPFLISIRLFRYCLLSLKRAKSLLQKAWLVRVVQMVLI